MNSSFSVAILAGGKGKRMRSAVPKFLHKVNGKEMLARILEAIAPLGVSRIFIIMNPNVVPLCSHLKEEQYPTLPIEFVHQCEPLGTGHALQCLVATKTFKEEERLLVLNADMPFLQTFILQKIMDSFSLSREEDDAVLLAAHLDNPKGYGRILFRYHGLFLDHIEEDKDCKDPTNPICNMGLYAFSAPSLVRGLSQLTNHNVSQEYYLTQVFDFLDRTRVIVMEEKDTIYLRGVNSPEELVLLESEMKSLTAQQAKIPL